MTTPIPLREGLFRETAAGPTLLASRCASCGRTVYPAVLRCLDCGRDGQQTVELGAEGELLCATVVRMGNDRFAPDYVVGYVTMPHGVRVFGQLAGTDGKLPAPKTRMRLEIAPMWRSGDRDVLAYRFTPATVEEPDHA